MKYSKGDTISFLARNKTVIIIALVVVAFLLLSLKFLNIEKEPDQEQQTINYSCISAEQHKISGNSLFPLFENGDEAEALMGYYSCNPVTRNDIVALKFKTREEFFVKILYGLPGDKIEFEEEVLKINGEVAKNSLGEAYVFSEKSKKLISVPLKDGEIPNEKYLVLSNQIKSLAFDSRQFSLVEKEHLKGKVSK